MIKSVRVTEVEAKRNSTERPKGFDVLFNIENIEVNGNEIKIDYAYNATYKDNIGYIKIKGTILAEEDEDLIKKIEEGKDKKKLPPEYMQNIVNIVNYVGSTNATLISNVINLAPPIKLPILRIKEE